MAKLKINPKSSIVVLCWILIVLLGLVYKYVFASIKQVSYDYNIVTFDLTHNIHLPPSKYQPIWNLAFPDISLKDLRLVYSSKQNKEDNNMLQILNLDSLIENYPIQNTYLENNIRFILTDQFRLLKKLKTDQEKLRRFRQHTKQLLKSFLKDTELYRKYINIIKDYKPKIDFYHLSHIARIKSLKRAKLLQSSSPYQSIKLSNINSNLSINITKTQNNILSNKPANDSIMQFIKSTINFIKDNWWLILAIIIYLYIMLIIIKKR